MLCRRLIVGSLALLSIGFSFADFQSEFQKCSTSSNISSCYEQTVKKYTVSKSKACTYKNDTVKNNPLQTSRPKEKTLTTSFYKYNNKLFYQVAVSKDQKFTADKVTSYMYMYDCKTKKSFDMSKNLPDSFLHIGDYINADDEILRFAQPIQFNKGKIFFQRPLGGLATVEGYFLFDTVKSLFIEIEIEKLKNYDKRYSTIALPEAWDSQLFFIDNINKDFIGDVSIPGDERSKRKVNLLTQTIEL